jgi:hypothetical protein
MSVTLLLLLLISISLKRTKSSNKIIRPVGDLNKNRSSLWDYTIVSEKNAF